MSHDPAVHEAARPVRAVAFALMREVGAGFWPAWFVGLGSAVIFYPPFAVPYMDQHSFFFSLCCLWLAVRCVTGTRDERWAIMAVPSLCVMAYLSKQIPAAFLAIPALAFVIVVGATGHPSISPALFLHPGLTIPPPATAAFSRFEQRLLDRIRAHDVRYVLEQPGPTWAGARLGSFPRVTALVSGCPRASADGWLILEICHRP